MIKKPLIFCMKKILDNLSPLDLFYRMSERELFSKFSDETASDIIEIRKGVKKWNPGYDGVYGTMEV